MANQGKSDQTHLWNGLSIFDAQEVFFSVFDTIQEGVIIVDSEGIVCYMNPKVIEMTGWKQAQMLGKSIMDLHPSGPLANVIQTGEPIYDERHKMSHFNMEVTATTLPIYANNKMVGAVSLFRDINEVIRLSEKLTESQNLIKDLHSKINNMAAAKYAFSDLIGESQVFVESINVARRAAKTDFTVMIRGESGTGKELFASAIHKSSRRGNKAFIKVNCAAVPDNLLESEFFGYEKGAFTGANTRKLGMFELANGGTIFLDEIGDMNLSLQAKLLRVLEEGEIYRLGGIKPIKLDARVIAATNRDLQSMIKEGKFRKDLFYRLNVINIEIPPLRDRGEDIVRLARFIMKDICRNLGKDIKGFTEKASEILTQYNWPGNVRELRNCVERAAIMAENAEIIDKDLQFLVPDNERRIEQNGLVPLEKVEREMIKRALDHYGRTVEGKKEAAAKLKISLRTLYNKINKYKLE